MQNSETKYFLKKKKTPFDLLLLFSKITAESIGC
jgi:hypothetical protein